MSIGHLIELVPYGTSKRFLCPKCQGLNTLSITKEGSVVKYHCYKNSCELHTGGSRVLKLSNTELRKALGAKTQLEARTEVKPAFVLPIYWVKGVASKKAFQMLLNSNCIEAYTTGMFNVAYDPRQDRLVFLVKDEANRIVGAIGRALSGQHPKVYNYPNSAGIPFTCGKGSTAVIVEDCASACSIARIKGYVGLPLLGTHLKIEYLTYIISNYENVIIALDPDAYSKSFKLKRSMEYYTSNVSIWKIPKDFKNMSKLEIQTFIDNQSVKS